MSCSGEAEQTERPAVRPSLRSLLYHQRRRRRRRQTFQKIPESACGGPPGGLDTECARLRVRKIKHNAGKLQSSHEYAFDVTQRRKVSFKLWRAPVCIAFKMWVGSAEHCFGCRTMAGEAENRKRTLLSYTYTKYACMWMDDGRSDGQTGYGQSVSILHDGRCTPS